MIGIVIRFSLLTFLVPLTLRLMMGVGFLVGLRRVNRMLVLSSNNTFTSFIILLCLSIIRGLLLFMLYVVLLWNTFNYFSLRVTSVCLLFGFIGMPPLFLFQVKWIVIEALWEMGSVYSLRLGVISGVSSLIYIRFIFLVYYELALSQRMSFYLF